MSEEKLYREHSPEFRIEIAARMVAGENVSALAEKYSLRRSVMYRWRDAYVRSGAAGLSRPRGRPKGSATQATKVAANKKATDDQLRQRIAELERKVGQQAVELDFFRGVSKRLKELPKSRKHGGDASTPRSGE